MRLWNFGKGFFIAEIREFEVLFWSLVFPLILYFFLSAILGSVGKGGAPSFELGVIKSSTNSMEAIAMEKTIAAVSDADQPFKATIFSDLTSAVDSMKRDKLDVVVIHNEPASEASSKPPIEIHFISGRESSEVAANILEIAFARANLEIAKHSGQEFRELSSEAIPLKISAKSKSIAYKDYIFPSVALMMILSVALFNSPLSLSFYRSSGTNKKLFTTPLKPMEYFGAHLFKLLATMLISLTLLYAMAGFIYRVKSGIFSAAFIGTLFLAMLTLVSFGLMIASLSRKESTAGILGQVCYQIMMFMGGFFFPVFGLPWGIRWLVYMLPTTYLVELLRRAMGVTSAPIGIVWLISVPMAWLILSAVVFSMNFRKVMGNE